MKYDWRSAFLKDLARYPPATVRTTAGALQLVPENGNAMARLEAFAYLSLCVEGESNAVLKSTKVRQLCNEGLHEIRNHDDPPENLHVETVGAQGGNYRIFPGQTHQITSTLQALSAVLAPRGQGSHYESARALLLAGLALSDAVAERAGLQRYTLVPPVNHRKVVVPDDATMENLRRAVRFDAVELDSLLQRVQVTRRDLDALVASTPTTPTPDADPNANPINVHPLVKEGDGIIVVSPVSIPNAIVAAIVRIFRAASATAELADRMANYAWDSVQTSLRLMAYAELKPFLAAPVPSPLRDGFFMFDTDKIAYVLLLVDTLADFNPDAPWKPNDDKTVQAQIDTRITSAISALYERADAPNNALILILAHGATRDMSFSIDRVSVTGEPRVVVESVADLRTIAMLHPGKNLMLWKFAGAVEKLHETTLVRATSAIDIFSLYHSREESLYFSDDARPDYILVPPASGASLRFEAMRKKDPHLIPTPDGRGYVSAIAEYTSRIGIYRPFPPQGPPGCRFIEGPFPAWVIPDPTLPPRANGIAQNFAEALAHWHWKSQENLEPLASGLKGRRIRLSVELVDVVTWESPDPIEPHPATPIIFATDLHHDTLHIRFPPGAAQQFNHSDNRGERKLLADLLTALTSLAGEAVSPTEIEKTVDAILPTGFAKKVIILDNRALPVLNQDGLPGPRFVPKHDMDQQLDDLGTYLRLEKKRPVGPIVPGQVNEVLHEVVAYFYSRFEASVAVLNPDGLLRELIARHEAIVANSWLDSHTSAITSATYDEADDPEGAFERSTRYALAAVCLRFIIEYVAARPPNGIRPMSDAVYDELTATAKHIISFGFDSDLVNFKLASPRLSILPSGRLGRSLSLDNARLQVIKVVSGTQLEVAARRLEKSYSLPSVATNKPEQAKKLDDACMDEFDFTLDEMSNFLIDLMNLAVGHDMEIATMPRAELTASLERTLGWPRNRIEKAIDFFSLTPRSNFLRPSGFAVHDVYPWRYGRALSYLRRPLIQVPGGMVTWGRRHTYTTYENLVAIITQGRLNPKSERLRAIYGEFTNARGREFEKEVAEAALRKGRLVRTSVKKIRTVDGKPLLVPGDIDVLAVDTRRHRIEILECKNLLFARTPAELHHEMSQLYTGSDTRPPAVIKHKKRVEFVKTNINAIIEWLGLDPNEKWRVADWIVLDDPPLAPFLATNPGNTTTLADYAKMV